MPQQKSYAIRCSTEEQARECREKGFESVIEGWINFIDIEDYTVITYEEAISKGLLGEKEPKGCSINSLLMEVALRQEPQKNEAQESTRLATQWIKYPVKDDGQGMYIFDEKGSMICQVRGWGELQKQPNGIEIQDDVAKFISEAINYKLSKESPSEDNLVEKIVKDLNDMGLYDDRISEVINKHLSLSKSPSEDNLADTKTLLISMGVLLDKINKLGLIKMNYNSYHDAKYQLKEQYGTDLSYNKKYD